MSLRHLVWFRAALAAATLATGVLIAVVSPTDAMPHAARFVLAVVCGVAALFTAPLERGDWSDRAELPPPSP